MIFLNPRGAPELACDQCGCRWFGRTEGNTCYECGADVTAENLAEIEKALAQFAARREPAPISSNRQPATPDHLPKLEPS